MDDRFSIKPFPKQQEFILSTARFACYSGGWGAGKTWAGCLRGLLLSQSPGNVGLIGRYTYRELKDTTQKTFFELCPPEYYDEKQGGRWSTTDNVLRLTNGSEILFRHMDTASEKELLSLNLGWFYIDQAEEVSEAVFRTLTSRLRLASAPNRYGFITCNPEPGSWIEKKFIKPAADGNADPNYHVIHTTTYDNPELPPDYLDSMLASLPEELRKRYIEGRWDVMENQIYPEFSRKIHVVKPFTTPKSWEYLVSCDYGMVNPTAVLLGAVDYDGNLFIIDEYYSPGVVSEHSKAIHSMTQNYEIARWLIDPSTEHKTREKDGKPFSIMEEFEDYGLYFSPANNEKIAGINRVKELLKPIPGRRHPITHESPAPRVYIFQNCVNTINEIVKYRWKVLKSSTERNAPEVPFDYGDHCMDSARYMIMDKFPPPKRTQDPFDLVTRMERKRADSLTHPGEVSTDVDSMLGGVVSGELL